IIERERDGREIFLRSARLGLIGIKHTAPIDRQRTDDDGGRWPFGWRARLKLDQIQYAVGPDDGMDKRVIEPRVIEAISRLKQRQRRKRDVEMADRNERAAIRTRNGNVINIERKREWIEADIAECEILIEIGLDPLGRLAAHKPRYKEKARKHI